MGVVTNKEEATLDIGGAAVGWSIHQRADLAQRIEIIFGGITANEKEVESDVGGVAVFGKECGDIHKVFFAVFDRFKAFDLAVFGDGDQDKESVVAFLIFLFFPRGDHTAPLFVGFEEILEVVLARARKLNAVFGDFFTVCRGRIGDGCCIKDVPFLVFDVDIEVIFVPLLFFVFDAFRGDGALFEQREGVAVGGGLDDDGVVLAGDFGAAVAVQQKSTKEQKEPNPPSQGLSCFGEVEG